MKKERLDEMKKRKKRKVLRVKGDMHISCDGTANGIQFKS